MSNYEINGFVFVKCPADCVEVTIPNGIKEIAGRAFENCTKLKSIHFNDELEIIKQYAFNGCSSLKEIVLNEGLKTIVDCAFINCSSLKSVYIPSSLEEFVLFDNYFSIFEGCQNINSITIGDGNKRYSSLNSNVIFDLDKATLLFGCSNSTIPPQTKTIGCRAFYKQNLLKNIDLPDGLLSIENQAFYGCFQLRELSIPKSVMKIDSSAFIATNLESVKVDSNNLVFEEIDNVIINKENKSTILSAKNAIVPEDVVIIGKYSFAYNNLKRITIPHSVKIVDDKAFIGSKAEEIVVQEGVLEIGSAAFRECQNLKTVYLPHSLLNNIDFEMDFGIANNAFFMCPSLSLIVFDGTKKEWKMLCSECGLSFKQVEIICNKD